MESWTLVTDVDQLNFYVLHRVLGNYCKECYIFRLFFLFIFFCFVGFSSVFLIP